MKAFRNFFKKASKAKSRKTACVTAAAKKPAALREGNPRDAERRIFLPITLTRTAILLWSPLVVSLGLTFNALVSDVRIHSNLDRCGIYVRCIVFNFDEGLLAETSMIWPNHKQPGDDSESMQTCVFNKVEAELDLAYLNIAVFGTPLC